MLTEGQVWDWSDSPAVVGLSALAAASLGAFAARGLLRDGAFARLDLLRDRRFLACTLLAAGSTGVYLASLSTISKMVTGLMGYASGNVAEIAGPSALALLVLVPVLAEAAGGVGGRLTPAAGLAVLSGGALWLSSGNLFRRWTEAAAVYNMFRNLGARLGLCLASVFQERVAGRLLPGRRRPRRRPARAPVAGRPPPGPGAGAGPPRRPARLRRPGGGPDPAGPDDRPTRPRRRPGRSTRSLRLSRRPRFVKVSTRQPSPDLANERPRPS